MLFHNQQFKIYGTAEEPLFLVNDIVCGLLGARDITNNQFFNDHSGFAKYVTTLEFPGCSIDIQNRYKCNKPKHINFFTELGLYKCLMRSNKPVAE
jgi:prophage antirepressor-like protein